MVSGDYLKVKNSDLDEKNGDNSKIIQWYFTLKLKILYTVLIIVGILLLSIFFGLCVYAAVYGIEKIKIECSDHKYIGKLISEPTHSKGYTHLHFDVYDNNIKIYYNYVMKIKDKDYSKDSSKYIVEKDFTLYKSCSTKSETSFNFHHHYKTTERNAVLFIFGFLFASLSLIGLIFAIIFGFMGISIIWISHFKDINIYRKKSDDTIEKGE